jgi:hypothetical protein
MWKSARDGNFVRVTLKEGKKHEEENESKRRLNSAQNLETSLKHKKIKKTDLNLNC